MSDPYFTEDARLRIEAIEEALDNIWALLQRAVNKEQFNRLNVIQQKEIDCINTRITSITADVQTLQEEVNSLL